MYMMRRSEMLETLLVAIIPLLISAMLWVLCTQSILFDAPFVFTLVTLGLIVCVIIDVAQNP